MKLRVGVVEMWRKTNVSLPRTIRPQRSHNVGGLKFLVQRRQIGARSIKADDAGGCRRRNSNDATRRQEYAGRAEGRASEIDADACRCVTKRLDQRIYRRIG